MCSADLAEFIERNHLDLSVESTTPFNPRDAFWLSLRFRSRVQHSSCLVHAAFPQPVRRAVGWSGCRPQAGFRRYSVGSPTRTQNHHRRCEVCAELPLSGTPYDPYGKLGDQRTRHMFRPIGINRQSQLAVMQIRPYRPQVSRAIQWIAYGSNPFNTLVPFFPTSTPRRSILEDTTTRVTSEKLLLGEPHHRGPCAIPASPTPPTPWNAIRRRPARWATAWLPLPTSRSNVGG